MGKGMISAVEVFEVKKRGSLAAQSKNRAHVRAETREFRLWVDSKLRVVSSSSI